MKRHPTYGTSTDSGDRRLVYRVVLATTKKQPHLSVKKNGCKCCGRRKVDKSRANKTLAERPQTRSFNRNGRGLKRRLCNF